MKKSRQVRRAAERKARKAILRRPPQEPAANDILIGGAVAMDFCHLSDRQWRGFCLWRRSEGSSGLSMLLGDDTTLWSSASDPTRYYRVERQYRNRRGTMIVEYRCQCKDFLKEGAIDCKHIFAERLRRQEVMIVNEVAEPKKPEKERKATRRKPRKRFASDGSAIRTAQRHAREKKPKRLPELLISLGRSIERSQTRIIPIRPTLYRGGRRKTYDITRGMVLLSKICSGISVAEMRKEWEDRINEGTLKLKRAPCENTFSNWINDEELTPILYSFLHMTSSAFREREIGAIVDSSKVSQSSIAHAKEVEYGTDDRPDADWMKCHALVGVETMVVMDAVFSGSVGRGTHDINFIQRLVTTGIETFPLEYLLADKAYLSEEMPEWLKQRGMQAVIPLKKGWFRDGNRFYNEPLIHLREWFNQNENRDFLEVYRLRVKIEALFSLLKRMSDGYCWSRGRSRVEAHRNAIKPCTAWVNEVLCKLIYLNLRTTIRLEEETGVRIDYMVPSRRFPPPDEPLLTSAA